MKKVLMGNHAASWGVRLARVKIIAAYPITPQTDIVEKLSEMCGDGSLDARFLKVESEHSAMAAVIASQATGVRSFTASSSNGLALMHELLHWASGARLPIVMVNVNRALAPGWNIWADQQDSLSQRDTGWIQIYVENNQEILDSILQGYKIAETVRLPVMICYDAFISSHTCEPVDIPGPDQADRWLPPYIPEAFLDPDNPSSFYSLVMPDHYLAFRYKLQKAHEQALSVIDEAGASFGNTFNRFYGCVETIECNDADIILVTSGTITSPARLIIGEMRKKGIRIGLLKMRVFRPFPVKAVQQALNGAKKVLVIDRNCSWGKGGIFADEIKSALYPLPDSPLIYSYIAGLGGKSITPEDIRNWIEETLQADVPAGESLWKGLMP